MRPSSRHSGRSASSPGFLTTRLFALIPRNAGGERPTIIIQHESGLLSLLLVVDGTPELLRNKPLPAISTEEGSFARFGTALDFIREKLGIDGEIEVKVEFEDLDFDAEISRGLADDDSCVRAAETALTPCGPTTVADRLGPALLAPALLW